MIKTRDDEIYNSLKNSVGFDRSPKFLKWVRENYGKTPHHVFGSYTSKKTSDYCIIPVTPEEHEFAEKHKSEYAIDNLHRMIKVMISYIKHLENKK